MHRIAKCIATSMLGLLTLAACGQAEQAPAPPPIPVEVLEIQAQAVPHIVELPGRIQSVRMAEVRARTDGIVERRLYEEGEDVKAGTPLFLIDQRDYRAQVMSAQAALSRANAARQNAASVVARYKPLMSERAVSAQEYDVAQSELQQADAQVSEARAALARAQLLLSYTIVRAPIAGHVGRAEITEGALVSGTEATLLTRVDQASPVYAVFAASSASILDTIQQVRRGEINVPSLARVDVELELENGQKYETVGHLDFTSPVVDPETGSRSVRALFDNPAGLLASGQFVRGRISAGTLANGILVPARAVQIKGETASISVLGKDGSVASRKISLGELLGRNWVVATGLKPGEQVIVEGWQKLRPGQKAIAKHAGVRRAAPPKPAQAR